MAPSVINLHQVPVIGLVGGVGSGKSSVAAWLARRLRVCILNADAAGHRVLQSAEVQARLRERFGPNLFEEGAVRRDRLAELVFGDEPLQRAARRDLEAIVHPVIRREVERELQAAQASNRFDVILLDAALLLEAGWRELCNAVVYIETPHDARLERVEAGRGWDAAEFRRREESQLSLDEKRLAADVIVDNSGSIERAGEQLTAFLSARYNSAGRAFVPDARFHSLGQAFVPEL